MESIPLQGLSSLTEEIQIKTPQVSQQTSLDIREFLAIFFFFSVVYLTLALNNPVKIYSLIYANEKIHINKAKYTIKYFLHIYT